jgi:hypothetical protein
MIVLITFASSKHLELIDRSEEGRRRVQHQAEMGKPQTPSLLSV